MGTTPQGAADPPPSPDRSVVAPRLAGLRAVFVWGAWAVLSVGLVSYVWLVNDDFPIADDLHLVAVYTGHQPVTASWLWEQYNEHRLPLPKLLLVLAGAATGHDYRAGVLLSALTLSALAALMIRAAARLRGGLIFADAFFPLVLLHWGQSETLLISYAVNLVASTALVGMALVIVVGLRGLPTLRQGLLFGLCLLVLPLSGSSGAGPVPALAVWLTVAAVACWRSGTLAGRRDGALMMALALTAVALLACYLLSLDRPPRRISMLTVGRASAEFLTAALGPGGERLWPPSGPKVWPYSGLLMGLLALLTLFKLAHDWRADPGGRLRTLGFLCVGGAMVTLALGIGWSRGSGFETRYVTVAAPVLCLAYFVSRTAPRPAVARWLFFLMAALLVVNTGFGVWRGKLRRERMHERQADVASGMTPDDFAKKWSGEIFMAGGEAGLAERLEMLRQAGQGPYKATPKGRGD
jgi:hypothetical protein